MSNRSAGYFISLTTDETEFTATSQRYWALMLRATLTETLRKLDQYIADTPEKGWKISPDAPAWWQGAVVIDGEIIQFRWREADVD
jgi:hypothetical protein